MNSARTAMGRIRRLTGQAGLCPGACRRHSWHACRRQPCTGQNCGGTTERGRGSKPAGQNPEAGEPAAGAGSDGEFPDDKSGGCDGRVGITPGGVPPEQQNPTPCAKADVVAQGAGVRPGRLHLRPGWAWLIQASEISAGKAQAF